MEHRAQHGIGKGRGVRRKVADVLSTMSDDTKFYFPIYREMRKSILEANECLSKVVAAQRFAAASEQYQYLQLKFYDPEAAQLAEQQIAAFTEGRAKLGYETWTKIERISDGIPDDRPANSLLINAGSSGDVRNVLKLHYDHYIPKEYRLFLADVAKSRLHFFPLASPLVSSLKQFIQTYSSIETIRLLPFSFAPHTNDYCEEKVVSLHVSLLAFARKIIPILLPKAPVRITVDGDSTHIIISVDGVPKKLSPTQTRGVVALALLPYDHWFPIDDFYRLIHSRPQDYNSRDFGAALDILKNEHEPFAWGVDDVLRRINGAVIESLVDEVVLRLYLDRKKKPPAPNTEGTQLKV